MNNPFKIIGISLILSILGIFLIFELPKMLIQFTESSWLAIMTFAILLVLSVLINLFLNTQRLNEKTEVKSNH